MLIEVDEECLFQNKQFSLQFDSDILDGTSVASTTTNDTQKLIAQDAVGNEPGSFPEKIARKIKHSFTKEYISDRAEKLRKYTERLLREAVAMERNPTISDLLNEYVYSLISRNFSQFQHFLHLPNDQFGLPLKSRGKETDQLGQIYEYGSRGLRPLLRSVPLSFSAVDVSSAQPWEERPASTVVRRNASTGTACATDTRARQTHRRQQHTTRHHSV